METNEELLKEFDEIQAVLETYSENWEKRKENALHDLVTRQSEIAEELVRRMKVKMKELSLDE